MDTFNRTLQGTEPLIFIHYLKTDTAIRTKGSFLPACGFCAGQ